jgi:hypothetical protein
MNGKSTSEGTSLGEKRRNIVLIRYWREHCIINHII